jgi:deoxyribonuclease V
MASLAVWRFYFMNLQKSLHRWDLSPGDAIALQNKLAAQLIDQPFDWDNLRTVAGVDVSVVNNVSQAAVVVLTYPDLQPLETVTATMPTPYPYIPGLLTFREGPVLLEAFARLQHTPDVFMFDGMGRIHPRRMGIAAHMGLWLRMPTMGCGKTPFVGQHELLAPEQGSLSVLTHRREVIGSVVRTRANVQPVYISAGHLMTHDDAVKLALRCTTRYRLPEPIRAAHRAAGTRA